MIPVKRKIAINGSMLDHQPSGIGVYSINLINHLFLLYPLESTKNLTVFTPSRLYLNPKLKIVKLVDLLQSSRYGKLAAVSRFLWNTFIYPFCTRRFDLLFSPTTHASFISQNQILTIHDLLSLRFGNINGPQRFYYKYLLPLLVKRATLIIAVSEATKKDIIQFLNCPKEKIKVIYNGYDHARYNVAEQSTGLIKSVYGLSNYFLVIGPTYAHKNTELLLEAYRDLPEQIRLKHPLAIAGGKQPYLNLVQTIATSFKLEAHVYFLGYVPEDHMAALYKEAYALVFPSLHEGFGLPLLEAMACGCPVITSDTSSMPEVCGEAAQYIQPLEKKSIMQAMLKLATHPELCRQLKAKGLKQAAKFSWERTAADIKTIIEHQLN